MLVFGFDLQADCVVGFGVAEIAEQVSLGTGPLHVTLLSTAVTRVVGVVVLPRS